ncbi:polysaccharide lyase [Natronorubrum sp. A-ect3]|uniref:polysaccharide lyase n=1 Tax=Natronorubrum sp. A-ect3 TaxID=3242698 RepID=UPI00359DDD37
MEANLSFNTPTALESFTERFHDEHVSISDGSTTDSGPDRTSCEVFFPEGSHYGADLSYQFRDEIETEPDSMYASYWLYLDETFQPATDGKLPGFAGRYAGTAREGGWGSRITDGTNGWSARGVFDTPDADGNIRVGNYVYHVGMDTYGTFAWWDATLERGRWYQIDQYIELNTPGENDGVLEGWVNQEQVYTSDDWHWRDEADIGIQEFWCNFYHGNVDPAPQAMTLYMDNLYFETRSEGA